MATAKKVKRQIAKMIEKEGVEVVEVTQNPRNAHFRFKCLYKGEEFTLFTSSSTSDTRRAFLQQRTDIRHHKREIDNANA